MQVSDVILAGRLDVEQVPSMKKSAKSWGRAVFGRVGSALEEEAEEENNVRPSRRRAG